MLAFVQSGWLVAKHGLEVLASIVNAHDDNRCILDNEGHCHTAAVRHRTQPRTKIVTGRSDPGMIRKDIQMVEDPVGKAQGYFRRCSISDVIVDRVELVTRLRRDDNAIRHSQLRSPVRSWRAARPERTSSRDMPRSGSAL